MIILDENDNVPIFVNTPYEGMVNEESAIGTTIFKWIHVEDLDKVGEPLEVRCESNSQVINKIIYLKIVILAYDIKYNTKDHRCNFSKQTP